MPRSVRDSKLDSRTARLKLKKGKRHWRAISKGLALGYWRGKKSSSWLSRKLVEGKYHLGTLGKADDYEDADGHEVLDFYQAQERAREWSKTERGRGGPYSVREAVVDYLKDFEGKSEHETRRVCERYILPKLGDRLVNDLTTREIRRWRDGIKAAKPRARAREDEENFRPGDVDERARRATANRILTVLKAVLNHAWRESGKVPSNEAWSKVQPYQKVDGPRVRYLTDDECRRLVNACAEDIRPLVQAALFTGARYGEITRMKVGDYDSDAGTVYIEPSKGDPRHTYLTDEGRRFFDRVALKRGADERLFLRPDGEPWAGSQQVRRIREASQQAKVDPPATFHVLRHSYGSALARQGVALQVIAEGMGHANIEITRKHYAHLAPSHVAEAIRSGLPEYGFKEDNVSRLRNR